MRSFIIIVFSLILLLGCGGRSKKSSSTKFTYTLKTEKDTLTEKEQERQKELYEFLIGDTLPEETDGTFDDFIYSFASNPTLQLKRIIFPLPYYDGDGVVRIKKEEWKHDSLFVNDTFYTLLFDSEKSMDEIDVFSSKSIQLEWYLLDEYKVKRYYFEKINELWFLEAINMREMEKDNEEEFFDFFAQFTSDSIFQAQRIKQPLDFVTIDPDDEFSILETQLESSQWFAFKPPLPKGRLFNINYGQEVNDFSKHKIVVLRGIGNGFFNALFFANNGGKWKLYKFEDTSI